MQGLVHLQPTPFYTTTSQVKVKGMVRDNNKLYIYNKYRGKGMSINIDSARINELVN